MNNDGSDFEENGFCCGMITSAAVQGVRAAVSVFAFLSILLAGLGAFLGVFMFSAYYADSLEAYKDALAPVGAFMIVVPVVSAVGWMVQTVMATIKSVVQLRDWLSQRRDEVRFRKEMTLKNVVQRHY